MKSIIKLKKIFMFLAMFFVAYGQIIAQTSLEKSISISKENLRQILLNDNKKQSVNIVFSGYGMDNADSIKSSEGIHITKSYIPEINAGKKKAIVELINNIAVFRKFLEINNIKFIYSDNFKIRVSNVMTQEEANVKAANVIDMAPVSFKAEDNDTTKKDSYVFKLYYYETKLRVSMDNYSENLLQGYIDKFQTLIEEIKIRLNHFN